MLENPQLAAHLAADAAAPKATANGAAKPADAARSEALPGPPGSHGKQTKGAAKAAAKDEDSGGSGMFDDVGDDYEVDTSKVKQKQDLRGKDKVCTFVC